MSRNKWTDMIIELQSLAQAGLTYGRDDFDLERYARIRDIAAEMMSDITDIPKEKVRDLFCSDSGYQTPKIDTRAAIFKDGRILLVHERNGFWSLPGGWCELFLSVSENTVKEDGRMAQRGGKVGLLGSAHPSLLWAVPAYAGDERFEGHCGRERLLCRHIKRRRSL